MRRTTSQGIVLDMGRAAGYSSHRSNEAEVSHVLAVDINPLAIEAAKLMTRDASVIDKMEFVVSDLFDNVDGVFNWIVFNPPYLHLRRLTRQDMGWRPRRCGCNRRFLDDAMTHLRPGGSILLIVSSETDIELEKYATSVWWKRRPTLLRNPLLPEAQPILRPMEKSTSRLSAMGGSRL